MAVDQQASEIHLKYLDFFRLIVLRATSYVASIYEYAKESSGPLKPGVDSVEGTVKTVVGPVYKQFHSKPAEFLQFIDSKVDGLVALLEEVFPQFLKDTSHAAYDLARQASDAASTVVADVKDQGVVETAKSYYDKYGPVAEDLSIRAFQTLLTVPFAHQVVTLVAPAALFGADKLNCVVFALKEHHVPLSEYIPVLPVEKIHEVIRQETEAQIKEKGVNGTTNQNGNDKTETSASSGEDSAEEETQVAPEQTVTAAGYEEPTVAEKEVERTPKTGDTLEAS